MEDASSRMPKVSVVVPVYNTEAYLARCLDSLIAQTLQGIEIIVVNDGSTDGSQGIIDTYAARYPDKIRVARKGHGGPSDARNHGIALCRGTFIGFVDSDDYVATDMYAHMYTCALEGGFDLVTCDCTLVYRGRTKIIRDTAYDSTEAMLVSMYVPVWNKLVRRSLLTESGLGFMPGKLYEDIPFSYGLALWAGRSGHVASPFYAYVQRSGSIMHGHDVPVEDIFDVMAEVRSLYGAQGRYTQHEAVLAYLHARLFLNSSFIRICRQQGRMRRHALARASLANLEALYPSWRVNPYVRKMGLRYRISMFCMRKWTVAAMSDVYRAILWIQQTVGGQKAT